MTPTEITLFQFNAKSPTIAIGTFAMFRLQGELPSPLRCFMTLGRHAVQAGSQSCGVSRLQVRFLLVCYPLGEAVSPRNRKTPFMLLRRSIRVAVILLGALSSVVCSCASSPEARLPTSDEIQMLFDIATFRPMRLRVVADITSNEQKWSDEEVGAEIKRQNDIYPDLAKLSVADQKNRTNAVIKSHNGQRTLHVQEWYSGRLYRLDQTDEALVPEQYIREQPGVYWSSFVNIDDPTRSPYRSYFANHQLHDVQLSKTALYAKNDLWRAAGLEGELSFPLLLILMDSKSLPKGRPFTDAELGAIKMDTSRAAQVLNGSNPISRLETIAEGDRTRFNLRGRFISPVVPAGISDMEFSYEIRKGGQRPVCTEGSYTNHTLHDAFFSTREQFDVNGFPRVWKRTSLKPDSLPKHVQVVFREVELGYTQNDEMVFSTAFPSNYIVSDVTSGEAVILQKPSSIAKTVQPLARPKSRQRFVIFGVFGLATLGIALFLLRMRDTKPSVEH